MKHSPHWAVFVCFSLSTDICPCPYSILITFSQQYSLSVIPLKCHGLCGKCSPMTFTIVQQLYSHYQTFTTIALSNTLYILLSHAVPIKAKTNCSLNHTYWFHYQSQLLSLSNIMLIPLSKPIALFIIHTDSIIKTNCSLYQTLCWFHYQSHY